MNPRLVFRPEAETEVLVAKSWYEEQRAGLEERFAFAVERTIAAISQRPHAYPRVHGQIRRAIVRKFPYAVFFQVLGNEIVVLSVMHGRRHPSRWQSRAEG